MAASLSAQNIDDIKGTYFTDTKLAKVKLERSGDRYNGRMIWNNEQGDTPECKILVLRNLEFGRQMWTGRIYDPRNKSEYDVDITLTEDRSMKVTARKGILKKSFVWKRIG